MGTGTGGAGRHRQPAHRPRILFLRCAPRRHCDDAEHRSRNGRIVGHRLPGDGLQGLIAIPGRPGTTPPRPGIHRCGRRHDHRRRRHGPGIQPCLRKAVRVQRRRGHRPEREDAHARPVPGRTRQLPRALPDHRGKTHHRRRPRGGGPAQGRQHLSDGTVRRRGSDRPQAGIRGHHPRHHGAQGGRTLTQTRQGAGRECESGQIRVPRQHVARDPHTHERRAGLHATPGNRPGTAGAVPPSVAVHMCRGQPPHQPHRRHPRPVQDRGGRHGTERP